MREIKFRAWTDNLKDEGEMYYQYTSDMSSPIFSPAGYGLLNPSIKVMQYTGLKDKNGVEIYEGDIIKFEWLGERCQCCKTKLEPDSFYTKEIKIINGQTTADGWDIGYCLRKEVIGNIHEHPQLLN